MKNKLLFYLILSVCIFSFASCNDDNNDNYIKQNELPEAATAFINTYLGDSKFVSARKLEDYSKYYYYEVNLEGNILITFGSTGIWDYMQSDKGLPTNVKTLLSREAKEQMDQKYAAAKIISLSNDREAGGKYIVLDNGKNLHDILTHEGNALAERIRQEDVNTLPQKTQDFVKKYFTTTLRTSYVDPFLPIVKFEGFRGTIYRLLVGNQAIVDFYSTGEWFYMKEIAVTNIIRNVFIREIPEDMLKVLNEERPGITSPIVEITRYNDNKYYGFTSDQKDFILIDANNKVIAPPLNRAKEYIKKTFNSDKELSYETRATASNFH